MSKQHFVRVRYGQQGPAYADRDPDECTWEATIAVLVRREWEA